MAGKQRLSGRDLRSSRGAFAGKTGIKSTSCRLQHQAGLNQRIHWTFAEFAFS